MGQQTQNTTPQSDTICIGVPVYPTAPPPPASTVSGRSILPPPPRRTRTPSSDSESSEEEDWSVDCRIYLIVLAASILGVCLGLLLCWLLTPKSPSFKVESVSVLFDKSNSSSGDATRAEWNLRLSVKAGTQYYKFHYDNLEVFFRLTVPDRYWWSRALVVRSSNDDPKDMKDLHVAVETLLPRSFVHIGSPLEFEVKVVVQFADVTWITATCNHMTVGISPDAKEGILDGGPRFCPYRG